MGVKAVPQGAEYTVERFGRYMRTLRPGLHVITPFIERIGARLSMMEQVLDVDSQEVITRDNAMVRVDGVVFFQILDAAKAAYEITDLQRAIINLTMTNCAPSWARWTSTICSRSAIGSTASCCTSSTRRRRPGA
jgi:regulator of protease activity HflC (stomatin/prohibitin superfamily)